MASALPDTLSPDQMNAALQGGGSTPAPASTGGALPDTLTPQQMQAMSTGTDTTSAKASALSKWGGIGRWLSNTATSIEQPFVSVAATPVQILAKALGHPDPYANGMPGLPGSDGNISVAPVTGQGLLQKAGQLGQIGTLALTPEAAGLSGILKMGAVGALGGVSSNLADTGKLDGTTLDAAKNGALFGSILGGLGNAARVVSGAEKGAALSPAMENEIFQTRPSTISHYIETAKNSAKDFHAPTVDDVVTQDIKKGANILEKKIIPQTSKDIETAKANAGPAKIVYPSATEGAPAAVGTDAVSALRDDINDKMQQFTGHQFSSYGDASDHGLTINNYKGAATNGLNEDANAVEQLPGRAVDVSPSEQKTLEYVGKQLQILQENPTVQIASDVLRNLDGKIGDWSKPAETAVGSFVRYARGAVNRVIAPAAPELAAANHAYGELMDIKNSVQDAAGKDLAHVGLLARRTVYAGESGKAQSVLDGLYKAVRPHLPVGEESYTTKAIVGRYAKDTFGGLNSSTGFAQGMGAGDAGALAGGYKGKIAASAFSAAKRVLAPEAENYALSISKAGVKNRALGLASNTPYAKGGAIPHSFVPIPLLNKLDDFLDSPSAQPLVNSFKKQLKTMGVSSGNVGQAVKDIFRAMLVQNLSESASQNASKRSLSQ